MEGTVLGVLLVLLLPRERRLTYVGKEGLAEHRGEYHSPSYWGRGDNNQFLAQGHNTSYMGERGMGGQTWAELRLRINRIQNLCRMIYQGLFCHDQVSSGKFLAFFNL